jgi:hypothetical protein
MDFGAIPYVAIGIAAPTMLQMGARAGLPIPAYVTIGQKAAMNSLDGQGYRGPDLQASTRFLEYNRAMFAQRGQNAQHKTLAKLTPNDLRGLCNAFLAATKAGLYVDKERYEITPGQNVSLDVAGPFGSIGSGSADARTLFWNQLTAADGRELTDLGNAAARVMKIRDGLATGFLSSEQDVTSGNLAVGYLANEMDGQGYLVTGKPEEKTLVGGLSAARDALTTFAKDQTVAAANKAASAAWDALKGSPALMIGAGLVVLVAGAYVWRTFQ